MPASRRYRGARRQWLRGVGLLAAAGLFAACAPASAPIPTVESTTPTPPAPPSTTPVATSRGPATSTPAPGAGRALLSLTFDDAIRNQYLAAWPQLQEYGMRGTFYALTGDLGNGYFMTAEDLTALHVAGNQIGSHTVTHARLTNLTAAQVEWELSESRRYLEDLLGAPVLDFAAPYGAYDATTLEEIRRYYRSHRTVVAGTNAVGSLAPYDLRACNVYSSTTDADIAAWVRVAVAARAWVVLLYHGITDTPRDTETTPAMFGRHLATIRATGISVVTVDQALAEIMAR